MISRTLTPRPFLLGLALTLSSLSLRAGEITIATADGNVPALLLQDATTYTDAVAAALMESTAPPVTSNVLSFLRTKVQFATLARIEYTYEKDGTTATRIYYSHSGHSITKMMSSATKATSSSSSGNNTQEPDSGDKPGFTEADDIAADAAEAKYYPADTNLEVRSPKLPAETSRLEATIEADKLNHSWDAELKALRRIEADIDRGIVPRGGRLTGYVSKTVCESCRGVIDTFADVFDANGTIYELIEPGSSRIANAPLTDIQRSQAASAELLSMRKSYAKSVLHKDAMANPRSTIRSRLDAIERLEEEEASAEGIATDACTH